MRILLPGRRHGDADPQLRHLGADQRAHRRLRPDQEFAHRQGAAAPDRGDPRRRRCAFAAGGQRAGILRPDRPGARHAVRPDGERHRAQSEHQPELVRAGVAEFLDRPEQRHPLLHHGADARIQSGLDQRPQEHAGHQVHQRAHPKSGAGIAQQRRHAHARQHSDQHQSGQHPAGL